MSTRYPVWLNLLLYQALWFIAVLGQETWQWLLPVPLIAHLWLCDDRYREAGFMVLATVLGVTVDSLLTLFNVFEFMPQPALLPVPLWLVAIWLAFAGTLRHGLRAFVARPWLMIALAAIGAPLSYLGAARLGAVTLPLGYPVSFVISAMVWMVLTGLLILLVRRVDRFQRLK